MNLTFDSIGELTVFLDWADGYRTPRGVSGSVGDVAFDTPQRSLQGDHVSIGAGVDIETRVYADGATVTGPGPLPDHSPAQQDADGASAAAEPTKRKRRTKAEIDADTAKSIRDGAAAAAAGGQNAGEAALEAARATLRDKEQPTGTNPFDTAVVVITGTGPVDVETTSLGGEAQEAVVTPFQHLTRAREFIAKHGMPKYNESFTKAGLDPNVMAYTAEQRALHLDALAALEQA